MTSRESPMVRPRTASSKPLITRPEPTSNSSSGPSALLHSSTQGGWWRGLTKPKLVDYPTWVFVEDGAIIQGASITHAHHIAVDHNLLPIPPRQRSFHDRSCRGPHMTEAVRLYSRTWRGKGMERMKSTFIDRYVLVCLRVRSRPPAAWTFPNLNRIEGEAESEGRIFGHADMPARSLIRNETPA